MAMRRQILGATKTKGVSSMSDISNLKHLASNMPQTTDAKAQVSVRPITQIPEETLNWIAEQARSGASGEAIFNALTGNGWEQQHAHEAVIQTINQFFPGYARNPYVNTVHTLVVPEPLLDTGHRLLDAGDRQVELVMTSMLPRVVVFDGFMSDEECDSLIDAARPRMQRSGVIQPMTGVGVVDDIRTSTGMFFVLGETPLIDRIEKRIARLLHWPTINGEGMQLLNYQAGAEYKPHQDFFDPTDPGTPKQLGLSGPRVGTFLMYLNTPERGGGTNFPDGGLEVCAKKGRAVFFSYDQPTAMKKTLHGGMPVLDGEKWAATKWLRRKPFSPIGVPLPT